MRNLTSAGAAPRLDVARHEAAHAVACVYYTGRYPSQVILHVTDDFGTSHVNGRQGNTQRFHTGAELKEIRESRDLTETEICWMLAGLVQEKLRQGASPDWWEILLNNTSDDVILAHDCASFHEPNLTLQRRWLVRLCGRVAGFLSEAPAQNAVNALATQLLLTPDMDSAAVAPFIDGTIGPGKKRG